MASGGRTVAPGDTPRVQKFDKTQLQAWHPLGMLMPAKHGNEQRLFLDQDSYELTIANKYVLPPLFTFSVWAVSTDALTARGWPKIKLPEGVQQVNGAKFNYNVMPTTQVPKRGTVRFMSKQTSSFSLAITQKGIGSTFEGSALDTPFGPQLIAMEIRAYAESVNLGMAINTAINMVNTAHRLPYLQPSQSFGRSVTQEIARELPLWACIGSGPNRIFNELEEILRETPDLDTLYFPDKALQYVGRAGLGREVDILLYSINKENEMLITKSPDRLVSATTLFNGRVDAFDMPQFRLKNTGKAFQPLETINTIGEVYFMFPEENPAAPGRFSSRSLDIYLYDQPKDGFTKITFVEGLRNSHIWAPRGGYHDRLRKYLKDVNELYREQNDKHKIELQFPLSFDANKQVFYEPALMGNLGQEHLTSDDVHDAVESIVNQLTYAADGGKFLLHEANEEIKRVERLREQIENAPYNADYLAEVARLNIGRSVVVGRDGKPAFMGTPTSQARTDAYGVPSIAEWTPNMYGGMDVPTDTRKFGNPAGMWSAAGIKTLASLQGHPLQADAERAYNYLSTLVDQLATLLRSSALWSYAEMPVNLPVNDLVQLLMTAIWGPRVPVFLAAPMALARDADGSERPAEMTPVKETTRVVVHGIDPRLFNENRVQEAGLSLETGSLAQGRLWKEPGTNVVFWRTPSGVLIQVPAALIAAQVPAASVAGPTAEMVAMSIYPNSIQDLRDALAAAPDHYQRLLNWIYRTIVKLNKANDGSDLDIVTKTVGYLTTLNNEQQLTAAIDLLTSTAKSRTGTVKADYDKLNEAVTNFRVNDAEKPKAQGLFLDADPAWRAQASQLEKLHAAYEALGADVEEIVAVRKQTDPNYDPRKQYIRVGPVDPATSPLLTGYSDFTTGLPAGGKEKNFTADLEIIRRELKSSNGTSFVAVEDLLAVKNQSAAGKSASTTRVSVADVANATRFRTPLFFSWPLLQGALRVSSPWILPGNVDDSFTTPIALGLASSDLNAKQWQIPHYVQSQQQTPAAVQNWHDAPVFARLGLVSKAYGSNVSSSAPRSRGNVRSAAGLVDRWARDAMDIDEDAMDVEAGGSPYNVGGDVGGTSRPVDPRFAHIFMGDMAHNIAIVTARYSRQIIHRVAALAFLNTPINMLASVIDLTVKNVCLPFGMWAWRLNSRTVMGSLLLIKSGIESGANFYNGAKFTVSQDGTTDMWQTRAVITTDAHPIRPENHRLLRNVQPRAYGYGHACKTVQGPEEFSNPINTRGDIIFTVVPRRAHESARTPLSFINKVPGQINGAKEDTIEADMRAQHFPGAAYYGYNVYRSLFFDGAAGLIDFSAVPVLEKLTFIAENKQNNHLAFLGFNIRWNYATSSYNREQMGNGHRAMRKFNYPGAKDYLNGSGDILPEPSVPIAQYELY